MHKILLHNYHMKITQSFFIGQGRKIISEQVEPYKDKVRRIHTDRFILEELPKQSPLIKCAENASTTLKELKYEKEGKCHVKNANQVIWYFEDA